MPQYARPASTITDNDWVPSSGTDLWALVDEVTPVDTDYIQATANQTVELKFSSVSDPGVSGGHIIRIRGTVSTGSGGAERWTITLYQGTTLIATPFANTVITRTTYNDYVYTLSAAEADSITDYSDLRVRIVTSQGAAEVTRVSWIELEVPTPLPGYQVSNSNLFGEIGTGRNGPFCDSNGNLYVVLSDSASPMYAEVWKSTNNGQTWTEQDSANKPNQDGVNDILSLDVVQVGSVLHIATYSSTEDDVFYHTFRMSDNASPDTWGIVDKLVASYINTASEFGLSIAVQPDGDIIILSAGDDGTYFVGRECVEYHYSQDGGNTWTTKQTFLGSDSDNLAQAVVIGESGKIHGFAKEEVVPRYIHRSLTDVTATPSAIESASNGVTVSGENYVHGKPAIYYDLSGAEKIVFAYPDSTYTPYVTIITDDGTPANGVQASTTVIHRTLRFYDTTAHVAALALAVYNSDLYLIYANDTDKDIYYVKSTNGGAFGAPVEIGDSVTVDELSANIYIKSGTIYLGVIWIEGGPTSTITRYLAHSLGSAGVQLVANGITTGVPVLGSPTLGQKHILTANSITTGTPVLGNPSIGQVHALNANAITSGLPVLGTPTISIIHILVANGITTGNPILGPPTIGQEHQLNANSITSGSPILGTPSIGQEHQLLANGITTGSPILGIPSIGQEHILTANGIATGSPILGTPSIGQEHQLNANSITTGTPVLGSPSIGQVYTLNANGITSGIPILGSPTLEIAPNIIVNIDHETGDFTQYDSVSNPENDMTITSGAALAFTNYGINILVNDLTHRYGRKNWTISYSGILRVRFYIDPNTISMSNDGRIVLFELHTDSNVVLGQICLFYRTSGGYCIVPRMYNDVGGLISTNDNFISDSPHYIEVKFVKATGESTSDAYVEVYIDGTNVNGITGVDNYTRWSDTSYLEFGSFIKSGTLSGTFYLDELVVNDNGVLIGPLGNDIPLIANDINTGIPVLGTPSLGQTHALDANDINTGIPVLGAPLLGQTHALDANDINTGIPILGTPSIGQVHALNANGITTGSPIIGTPSIGQEHILTANDIISGSPILGIPSIGQTHTLDANDITTGIPILGSPTLSINAGISLVATDITTGIPILGTPSLGQIHILDANDVTSGIPVLGTPSLGQVYALDANDITTGIPILGSPSLSQIHILDANDITTGIPILGNPSLGQTHSLDANDINTGIPVLGNPTLTINQGISLVATDIISGIPVLGTPALAQIHVLDANDINTGIPVLDNPSITQIYVLDANDITTGIPILDVPIFGQIHNLVANSILTGIPVLGTPIFKFNIIIPDEVSLIEYKEWVLTLIEVKENELSLIETK